MAAAAGAGKRAEAGVGTTTTTTVQTTPPTTFITTIRDGVKKYILLWDTFRYDDYKFYMTIFYE